MNSVKMIRGEILQHLLQEEPLGSLRLEHGFILISDQLLLALFSSWILRLGFLILIAGVCFFIFFQIKKIKERNRLLEEELVRQAQALQEAKDLLLEKDQRSPENNEIVKQQSHLFSVKSQIAYPNEKSARDEELLVKTIHIIEKHISDPELNGDKICKELGISKSVLYVKLKNLTGQTVNEFIRTIRLKESTKQLLQGKLSITQISHEMGFNSPSYYSRSFVQYFGISPKEYIQKMKAEAKGV